MTNAELEREELRAELKTLRTADGRFYATADEPVHPDVRRTVALRIWEVWGMQGSPIFHEVTLVSGKVLRVYNAVDGVPVKSWTGT